MWGVFLLYISLYINIYIRIKIYILYSVIYILQNGDALKDILTNFLLCVFFSLKNQ